MATMKKPSWDLSREQIEAAARGLVLDRQHFAGKTARADSRSSTNAEIDAHVRQRMASMTADELVRISRAEARGESLTDAVRAAAARADSTTGDGLIRRDVLNDYGQLHHVEFTLKPGHTKRSAWMSAYMARPEEMIALNIKAEPLDVFESKRGKHLEEQRRRDQAARDVAVGRDVLVDLTYNFRDLEG